MGRIWRGLKLGMKSLLLHKLRSGLTVLGIVFGVAAVISMLADRRGVQPRGPGADPGARGHQHHRPLGQAQRRGPGHRRPARADPQLRPEVRRLRPDPRDRADDQEGPADPRDPQADPPPARTPSTAGSSARPHDYAEFNMLEIDRGRFLTEADNEKYQNYAVLAADDGQDPLPLRGPDRPVGQARHRLLHGRRRHQGAGQLGGHRRQPRGPGLQQGRLHPAEHLQAPVRRADHQQPVGLDGGRGDAALADHAPGRRRSTRSRPTGPDHRGRRTSRTTPRRTSR